MLLPSYAHRCSMSGTPSTNTYASRWQALLTENSILQKQHHDLLASFDPAVFSGWKKRRSRRALLSSEKSTSRSVTSSTIGRRNLGRPRKESNERSCSEARSRSSRRRCNNKMGGSAGAVPPLRPR